MAKWEEGRRPEGRGEKWGDGNSHGEYVGIAKFTQQFPTQNAQTLKFSLCTSGQGVTAFAGHAATHFFRQIRATSAYLGERV